MFAGLPLSIKRLSAEHGYAERQEVMGCGDKKMLVRAEIKLFLSIMATSALAKMVGQC